MEKWNALHEYDAAYRRMAGMGTQAELAMLRKRWPTLGDANRAMVAAFAQLLAEDRAADLAMVDANLTLIELGLI